MNYIMRKYNVRRVECIWRCWYNGVKEFNHKIIRKINGTIDYLLDAIFRHLFCEINLV